MYIKHLGRQSLMAMPVQATLCYATVKLLFTHEKDFKVCLQSKLYYDSICIWISIA